MNLLLVLAINVCAITSTDVSLSCSVVIELLSLPCKNFVLLQKMFYFRVMIHESSESDMQVEKMKSRLCIEVGGQEKNL